MIGDYLLNMMQYVRLSVLV